MSDKFSCPRRLEDMGADPTNPDEWVRQKDWSQTRLGEWNPKYCSYCGSLDPAVVMDGIKMRAFQLTPTDKSYKVYIESSGEAGTHLGKFYFQHLDMHQRQEFVKLLNAKKVNIGYPGYFYVLPFFAAFEDPTQPDIETGRNVKEKD